MERLLTLSVCLLFFCPLYAQNESMDPGAANEGLGGITTTSKGAHAVAANPAGISYISGRQVRVSASVPFGMTSLSSTTAAYLFPFKKGIKAAATVSRFGNKFYSDQSISAAVAHHIGFIRLGGRLNLTEVRMQETRTRFVPVAEFGGIVEALSSLCFGAYVYNFNLGRISKSDYLPVEMKAGMSWTPFSNTLVRLELDQQFGFPAMIRTGLQYTVSEMVFLRSGVSTHPLQTHWGAGLAFKNWTGDYAVVSHPYLGFSHYLSLSYLL